jgi:2-polyprenyl-3-methyl-5-hydroxy-6-metoxy-1,4-benzoquinol methylase
VIDQEKAIRLGHPSYVWRFGQDRRLDMIRHYVPLEGARVLDVGCGIGAYIEKFRGLTAEAFGVDVDGDKLEQARRQKGFKTLALSASEWLPFPDNTFDAVLLHEVIEHVADDRQTIHEAHRVVKEGGNVVVFAPNRLYPFETHGAYIGGRYVFGNIPLIGYLPDSWRGKLAPHVRAYRSDDLRDLFADLRGHVIQHTQIFPGYDKLAGRSRLLARVLRRITYLLESTFLRSFGLSHFLVWQKE